MSKFKIQIEFNDYDYGPNKRLDLRYLITCECPMCKKCIIKDVKTTEIESEINYLNFSSIKYFFQCCRCDCKFFYDPN